MKRLFTILTTLALLCAVGCEEQGDDNVNPNDKPNTEQPGEKPDDGSGDTEEPEEKPENIFFGLDRERVSISPDGGSVDVIVYSNYKWEISGKSDWCTPSVTSGEANEDGQKVTFSADMTYDTREAIFWFRCADKQIKFIVSQDLKEVIVADDNNTFSVSTEGGVVEIAYQTNVECEIIIPEEAQSWISLAPAETRGLVSESATLTVAENTTYSERSAVVKVVKVGDNTLFAEYTINQTQNDAIIAKNNTFKLKGWAQSINIAYKTNVECEVIIPEESQSWISLAPATRALVNESATLNIAENNTGAERSAVVKVVAANNNELVAEYTITQNQRYFMEYTSKDGFTVSPYSSAFDATIICNEYIDGKGYIEFDAPITSIGNKAFSDCSSLTSITIPDSVTEIGFGAFYYCTSLTSITIPDSVTSIGDGAFVDCTSLTSVTIPDGVTSIRDYAFWNCSSLTSITIPDGVTSIGDGAFYGCTSLTSFYGKYASEDGRCLIIDGVLNSFAPAGLTEYTIPDSVTSIGNSVFNNCTSLVSVTIGNGVTSIGESAFSGCTGELIINSKLVETNYTNSNYPSNYGWLKGAKFSKLTIGDGVTEIGNRAFYNCTSLTSVTIGDGVTEIGYMSFSGCTSLTSITIPDSVTSIGYDAFEGCSSLTNFQGKLASEDGRCLIVDGTLNSFAPAGLAEYTIPEGVTSIGYRAFDGCTSLTSVTIPDSVTSIAICAFEDCSSLTSITIGNGVTSIGEYAFGGCTGELIINSKIVETSYTWEHYPSYEGWLEGAKFTKLTIGNNVEKIGDWAFYECTSLTSITIPDSVTWIGDLAFYYCTSLTSVTIGNGVTEIGNNAFYGCTSLKEVYCKATTPPTGDNDMFSYYNSSYGGYVPIGCTIYVPTKSVDAYKKASYWSDYKSYIYGCDFE